MIIAEFRETIKANLVVEKQLEILRKVRKPIKHTAPEITEDNIETNDSSRIIDYKIGEDGGVRMYINSLELPVRLCPNTDSLNIIAIYKRFFISIVRGNLLQKIIGLIFILSSKKWLYEWLEYTFNLNQILLKDEHWSQPVKEIRRVLKNRFNPVLIDAISTILEYDNAYRFRLQDILSELDKSQLKGFKVIKELQRLFDIIHTRELSQNPVERTWLNMKKFTYLLIIPQIRKLVIDILKDLNIDEIRFNNEDLCYINKYGVYSYCGKTLKERNGLS
jgi:hypothetical protein